MGWVVVILFLPAVGLWLAALLHAVCAMRHVRSGRLSSVFWLSWQWPTTGFPEATFDAPGLRCWTRARRCLLLFVGYCACLAVALVLIVSLS